MRLSKTISAALLTLGISAGAQAGKPTERSLSLEDCLKIALEHNLSVQIARTQPDIDLFNLRSSYGTYDPTMGVSVRDSFASSPGSTDPNSILFGVSSQQYTEAYSPALRGTLPTGMTYSLTADQYRTSGSVIHGFQYSTDLGLTLTQPVMRNAWIDNGRLTILLNKKTLKMDELAVTFQIMNTVSSVEQAYYTLVYSRDNVRVQQSALELAERLLMENKKRVEVGALAPLDEKQAESQVATSKADLLAAQRDLATQENTLKSLLTDDYLAWHDIFINPTDPLLPLAQTFDLQDSWQKGMAMRPDLQQAREGVEKQNIVLRYTKNQTFPQLDLTGTYGFNGLGSSFLSGYNGLSAGSNPLYAYGVTFSIPLNNTAAKNNYKSAKVTKQQLLLQLKQLEQQIVVAIDNAVKQAQANYERIEATHEARLYAEAALDAEQKKLANGKSTSFVVLQLQSNLTAARSTEIRALADYNISLAQIRQNEGTILQKLHFNVEVK